MYRKSSPIEFIKQVKTPTLVIVGERDAECPAPQSYEFWHALRTLGVPTQLVVYKDEGHLLMDVKNRRDMQERMVAWLQSVLQVNGLVIAVEFQRRRTLFLWTEARILSAAERELILDAGARQIDRQQARFHLVNEVEDARDDWWSGWKRKDRTECRWRSRIAWSKFFARITASTGPKISSCAIVIFGSTSAKIVGSHEISLVVGRRP